jgi:hypothetical protein
MFNLQHSHMLVNVCDVALYTPIVRACWIRAIAQALSAHQDGGRGKPPIYSSISHNVPRPYGGRIFSHSGVYCENGPTRLKSMNSHRNGEIVVGRSACLNCFGYRGRSGTSGCYRRRDSGLYHVTLIEKVQLRRLRPSNHHSLSLFPHFPISSLPPITTPSSFPRASRPVYDYSKL